MYIIIIMIRAGDLFQKVERLRSSTFTLNKLNKLCISKKMIVVILQHNRPTANTFYILTTILQNIIAGIQSVCSKRKSFTETKLLKSDLKMI